MTSERYDQTAGSMRDRRRIYDVQVIEPGPLTNDAGRQISIFHRDISLAFFSIEKPVSIVYCNDGISEVGRR